MERIEFEKLLDLKRQHDAFTREGYDGHNRHSGIVGMSELGRRRARRRWNLYMRRTAEDWNSLR